MNSMQKGEYLKPLLGEVLRQPRPQLGEERRPYHYRVSVPPQGCLRQPKGKSGVLASVALEGGEKRCPGSKSLRKVTNLSQESEERQPNLNREGTLKRAAGEETSRLGK